MLCLFMSLKSNLRSATVITVPYVISWDIEQRYNGTQLYLQQAVAI